MYRTSHQLLSRSCLPKDQDIDVGGGDLLNEPEHPENGRRLAHDARKVVVQPDGIAQRRVLGEERQQRGEGGVLVGRALTRSKTRSRTTTRKRVRRTARKKAKTALTTVSVSRTKDTRSAGTLTRRSAEIRAATKIAATSVT